MQNDASESGEPIQVGGDALLKAFDALVRMDDGVPGFAGALAIGVRQADAEVWWHATFGAKATTAFLEARPTEKTDVEVLLGDAEALHFLRCGAFPADPALARVEGDVGIIDKMIERYVRVTSAVDLRAAAGGDGKPKRRRRRKR